MASSARIIMLQGYSREVPELRVYDHGRNTVIDNFKDLEEFFGRDPKKFFSKKVGARIMYSGKKAMIEAHPSDDALREAYTEFIKSFSCKHCKSFDTKDGKCEACGAFI